VSNPKRSSAATINVASTVTLLVLMVFASSTFLTGLVAAVTVSDAGVLVPVGAGVPERLGSVLTVRSFPWVSISAVGNSANFVSRAIGRRDLARVNNASTAGEESVVRVQLYWINGQQDWP